MCVVGDSDQSVYRWRGADIRNILEFERAFPNVTTIMLEQNFRSTQTILDAANAVIANNIGRQPKELFTVGDTGGPVKRYRAEDERDEAAWVSSEILRLHASEGLTWGDFAVFYRTNAQSAAARDVHEVQRHPLQGGGRGQVLRPPRDQGRPGLHPRPGQPRRRGLGPPHRQRPQARHRRHVGGPPGRLGPGERRVLQRGHRPRRGGRADRARRCKGAEQLSKTLAELRPLVQTVNPADFVQLVADRTGYLAELVAEHTHEADGRIENLAELATQAGDFDDVHRLPRDGRAGGGLRRARQRRHPGLADDAAHRQGPGVPGRLRGRAGGGDLPALPLAGRAERARGGAPPLLRRHHPGPPAPGHLARLVAHDLGPHPAGHAEPLRRPRCRRTWSTTSGSARPGGGTGYDSLSADEHLPGATFAPAVPLAARGRRLGRQGGARGSTGAEDLGLAPGDEVVHDHWGRGVVVSAKGEGSRAQATVDFDSVGKKNLLLSATPLRRA